MIMYNADCLVNWMYILAKNSMYTYFLKVLISGIDFFKNLSYKNTDLQQTN